MLFLSCFCYAFVCACLLMPCGHLLGKFVVSKMKLSLFHRYLGSGVVFDCIDI